MKGTLNIDPETVNFYDKTEVKVGRLSNSKGCLTGRVYVPREWIGKRVLCLLLDELDAEENL